MTTPHMADLIGMTGARLNHFFSHALTASRHRLFSRFMLIGGAMVGLVLLAGCANTPPAQSEQTNLSVLIDASSGLNPDGQGRAAPILVRVYELRSYNVFQESDFFSLYNADRTTLGNDILAVDQFILRPGQSTNIQRKSHPEVKAIGVLAGYRDLPNATWRAIYYMPPAPEAKWYRSWVPNQNVELRVDLLPKAVRITDLIRGTPAPGAPEGAAEVPSNTVPKPIPPDTVPTLPSTPELPSQIPAKTAPMSFSSPTSYRAPQALAALAAGRHFPSAKSQMAQLTNTL